MKLDDRLPPHHDPYDRGQDTIARNPETGRWEICNAIGIPLSAHDTEAEAQAALREGQDAQRARLAARPANRHK